MLKHLYLRAFILLSLSLISTGCFRPPFNDFKKPPPDFRLYRTSKKYVIQKLQQQDIQYVEYGDTMTLVVPTDHYFLKGTAKINDICYEGLNNIVKLLKMYPKSRIYVAGFSDNVGHTARFQRRLTQAQANAMLTFLWANGIQAKHLKATGFGELFPIGDNNLIHGSAFNRRIEIQWFSFKDDQLGYMQSLQTYHGMK